MRVRAFIASLLLFALAMPGAQAQLPGVEPPALVLTIVVDQFRYDYLARENSGFTAGLKRLLEEGAVFTNANYEAAPTMTAVGHSTIGTGAMPAQSGIAGNTWYSRSEGSNVQSITDNKVTPLGGGSGASPHRLLVSTVADELKLSGKGGKSYGVSLKDRGAILPVGRTADGAFWFDTGSGNFVSSSWYFPALPAWVESFNGARPADRYAGQQWMGQPFPAAPGSDLYGALDSTAFSDQLVLEFALALLAEEQLGRDAATDFLSVSFSAMDYLGHASGPDTAAMREMVRSIDLKVGTLLDAALRQTGRGRLLVVFSADHGVAPVPEENVARRLPGGRYDGRAERAAVEAALAAAFGAGNYIAGTGEYSYYLNYEPVAGKTIARADLENVAAETLRRLPHVYRVYTRTELESSAGGGDRIDQRMRNGFSTLNSGDVLVLHEPYWLSGAPGGTTHGSPFSYDTHVPMIFWGPRSLLRPGYYHRDAAIHDIAPTLATMLGIAQPSGAVGRILDEMLP